MKNTYQVYLISDSTGETLDRIFMALKAQFKDFKYNINQFSFTRTENQVSQILEKAKKGNSIVLYTIVDTKLAKFLAEESLGVFFKEDGSFFPKHYIKKRYMSQRANTY